MVVVLIPRLYVFFFNDTPTTEIYTLSLHDALPISSDLQAHSLHSDGHLPAAAVVEHAARAGVDLLALSDHDTIDGVEEAILAGVRHGVTVVPATEISAVDDGREDLHVLGYRIDHRDPVLAERLEDARADR